MGEKLLGSVSPRRRDGGSQRWLAQLPPSLGRRGRVFDSEGEAWQWLRQENAKAILGIRADSGDSRTIEELLAVWMAGASFKHSTRVDYDFRVQRHILSQPIAKMRIRDLLPMHIDEALHSTPENWTRIHVAKIWSAFCEWLDNNEMTSGNLYKRSDAKRIIAIQYRRNERKESTDNVWTPAQLVAFIEHEPDEVYRAYWVFIAATAARRGEAIGLRWANVHSTEGWCWLHDNIVASGSEVFNAETPKNYRRRKAYFGPLVGAMLDRLRVAQDEYRQSFEGSWDPAGWVFDRRRGKGQGFRPGVHLAPATVTARFNRHAAELGLPRLAGPHGLRRTWATLADAEGLRSAVRRDVLGHSPSDVTGSYSKAPEAELIEAADRIVRLLLSNE